MTGKRHGDPFAHLVRRLVNKPWDGPAITTDEAERMVRADYIGKFKRETGARTLVRCVLPAKFDGGPIIYDLERDLTRIAGGFTMTRGQGGWLDEVGADIVEHVLVFEVSCENNVVPLVLASFAVAGERLEQEWTHITTSQEFAEHRNTGERQ